MEEEDSSEDEGEMRSVLVHGCWLSFRNEKFHSKDFYQKVQGQEELRCCNCNSPIVRNKMRFVCIYCLGDTHWSCAPIICNCSKGKTQPPPFPNLPFLSFPLSQPSSLELKLPHEYLREREDPEEEKMRILLNARHFRYTRVAVFNQALPASFPGVNWSGVEWMKLPEYHHYIKGRYFPPIKVRPLPLPDFDPANVFGTQWGVFASKKIKENVVLGEYGCDVVEGTDLQLCRKMDSIMMYSGWNTAEALFLAPIIYCGYIPLINGE